MAYSETIIRNASRRWVTRLRFSTHSRRVHSSLKRERLVSITSNLKSPSEVFPYNIFFKLGSPCRTPATCIVAKNRHGETGKVELRWMPEYTQFSTLDKRYDDED